ncbi:MAG: nucleotidyltransferase family protein [Bacteroidota bacterium]|nr:nucleotidyltransferase family protein [Bacteroidota bacterium]
MIDIKKLFIKKETSLKDALKKLNTGAKKNLFVVDENNCLYGALTDGDIRRWIIKKGNIEGSVAEVCNREPVSVYRNYDLENVKTVMVKKNIDAIPIINKEKVIIDLLHWSKVFTKDEKVEYEQISLPVVIMAGGRGTRLDPFTRILPKPLIPIGDKPIIELIMDNYSKFGMRDFIISINHKGKMIKAYFEDAVTNYRLSYLNEEKPLGTAGSLKLLSGKLKSSFFVSNCDIIIETDYSQIFEFHKSGGFDLTLIASMKNYTIPYGVCEIKGEGELGILKEKPEYDFLINTGMYLLEPEVLEFIPENIFYHITDLINELKKQGKSIGVYPVSENSYIDVGQWEEYKTAVKKISG